MALGASDTRVVALFVRRAVAVAVAGILTGLLASYWASGAVEEFLFEVKRFDVPALVASAAILLIVTLTAAWLPARRAAAVRPMESLRA
jgi:ABC-type antimicrobial peptide transport system permease subunit